MRIHKFLKDAIKSIRKNKSRSLLTALGIIIGVAAVIVMVGVGQGAQQDIKQSIESLGTNMLMVFPHSSHRGGVHQGSGSRNRFTLDDVETIDEEAKHIEYISSVVMTGGQVIGAGANWNTSIYGVDVDYLKIRSWEIAKGENFDDKAVRARKKVAILGQTVATELFGDTDPLGQKIRIKSIPFTVIGVLAEKGQDARGRDQDDVVIAPSTSVLYRLKGGTYIDMMNVSATSEATIDSAKAEITAIMRKQHRLSPGEEDDFGVRSLTEITEMASSTAKTMTLLLAAIACVSLIVGGIGIMNIML
ncbi:MAG: ABC transporter permease, partial [Victivallales bacterium]|nr:ABC transporter permease [Victivallales bacterium]